MAITAPPGIASQLKIEMYSCTPKYRQLVNSFLYVIRQGKVQKGDPVPSINELSYELEIARQTIEKSYHCLKLLGVLDSVPRVGYFIKETALAHPIKILLLFNKLSDYKKEMYDAFAASLDKHAAIDFFVYNSDLPLFKRILNSNPNPYDYYIILPHFKEEGEDAAALINTLPKDKLLLLDKKIDSIEGDYAAVYENFETDIYSALQQANERLQQYHTLKIIFPSNSYYPPSIVRGFKNFCQDYAFDYNIIDVVSKDDIHEGEVYINLVEDDLVTLVEAIGQLNLQVGKQVGIISYNETPLKRIILDGITTISTDFRQMGHKAAELVLSNAKEQVSVPFKLILRASL